MCNIWLLKVYFSESYNTCFWIPLLVMDTKLKQSISTPFFNFLLIYLYCISSIYFHIYFGLSDLLVAVCFLLNRVVLFFFFFFWRFRFCWKIFNWPLFCLYLYEGWNAWSTQRGSEKCYAFMHDSWHTCYSCHWG